MSTKYRLYPSPAYNGQWVVQKWYPDAQVWADVGDVCGTRLAAERKLREVMSP